MAKGMREIKRQIKSTQNMRQITKAMEMVAASYLKKAQQGAEASRPYADKIREVIANIAASGTPYNHPILDTRPVKRTGYLVITSDRGLAGGFNSNLLRKILQEIREKHQSPDEYSLFVIGNKGLNFFKRRNVPVEESVSGLPDAPYFADIKGIAAKAVAKYADGTYDELYLVFNVFKNAMTQIPTVKRLLPLEKVKMEGPKTEYQYEPSPEAVLHALLPKYAETLIYSAVLESKASEFGARMTAMSNATKNASKMISSYTLAYNRARQAAITQEITEIVGGASALG